MLIQSESREETLTTSATTVTSQSAKGGTKTKKKKIEGVAGNDASPNLTPRTKKTKKSKKNELEKENISVVSETITCTSILCSLIFHRISSSVRVLIHWWDTFGSSILTKCTYNFLISFKN